MDIQFRQFIMEYSIQLFGQQQRMTGLPFKKAYVQMCVQNVGNRTSGVRGRLSLLLGVGSNSLPRCVFLRGNICVVSVGLEPGNVPGAKVARGWGNKVDDM